MVLDPSANFKRQSLGGTVGTNDPETIDVSDASAFPDPANGQYNVVVWDTAAGRPDQDSNAEIVRVTGRDTGADTLTVARAQEGTSNETHPNTSAVQLDHTAKLRDDTDSAVGSVGSFSGTPPTIDEIDVPEGPTDLLNADTGELQSKLSAATPGDVVRLYSGKEYDPGSVTTVPSAVTLDFNGAIWTPTTQYSGFLVSPEATLTDSKTGRAELDASGIDFSGQFGVKLDADSLGRYDESQRPTVVSAFVFDGDHEGDGCVLDAGTNAITVGNRIDIQTWRCDVGIHLLADGGQLNGLICDIGLAKNTTDILYTTENGSTSTFQTLLRGWMQTGSASNYGIRSTKPSGGTINDGIRFQGFPYDFNQYSTNFVDAEFVWIDSLLGINNILSYTSSSSSGYARGRYPSITGEKIANLEEENTHEIRHDFGVRQYRINGTRVLDLSENGHGSRKRLNMYGNDVRNSSGIAFQADGQPFSGHIPASGAMIYVSDGTDGNTAGDVVAARFDGSGNREDTVIAADADFADV